MNFEFSLGPLLFYITYGVMIGTLYQFKLMNLCVSILIIESNTAIYYFSFIVLKHFNFVSAVCLCVRFNVKTS